MKKKNKNIEKLIKIVEALMLMEGLALKEEDRNNIRECLANGNVEEKIKEIIDFYDKKER